MDYNYYKNYTKERQITQDIIIKKIINKDSKCRPWAIFTCGTYGSGKSYCIKYLQTNYINLDDFVHIDPDMVKEELPENKKFIEEDWFTASTRLHKESAFISELAEEICRTRNIPLVVDGSLQTVLQRCETRAKKTHRYIPSAVIEKIYNKVELSYELLKGQFDVDCSIYNDIAGMPIIQHFKLQSI